MLSKIFILLFTLLTQAVVGFINPSNRIPKFSLYSDLPSTSTATDQIEIGLIGSTLQCKFTGFGVEDMNAFIKLNDKSQATFSGGVESLTPGYWRIVDIGNDIDSTIIEITHPVLPEYLLFYDIWEKSILWKGKFNKNTMTIENGEVVTNKKRFGIFPYTDTLGMLYTILYTAINVISSFILFHLSLYICILYSIIPILYDYIVYYLYCLYPSLYIYTILYIATFTARILPKNQPLPLIPLPSFTNQQFLVPIDFDSPYDMKRYPQYFDPEYVNYFFEREEGQYTVYCICV